MTSPDESALLAAIRSNPADDAPRLVYADWLEENGESVHAELIRVQCELARNEIKCPSCGKPNLIPHRVTSTPWLTRCRDCNWSHGPFWSHTAEQIQLVKSLRTRERELLSAIMDNLPDGCRIDDGRPSNSILVKFTRGFVSHVTADWQTMIGGDCHSCYGEGRLIERSGWGYCKKCDGTGREVSDVLPKIVRSSCAVARWATAKDVVFHYDDRPVPGWRWVFPIDARPMIDPRQSYGYPTIADAAESLSRELIRWAWSVDPKEIIGVK